MGTIEKSIEVDQPIRTVYNQWTQFETFPEFMEGVEHVEQLNDTHLRWVAEIGGQRREWKAEITEQVPDQRVAWTSVEGAENAGVVTFHRIDDDTTRVTLQMKFDPESFSEQVGDVFGLVDRRAEADLERFKEFIEQRGTETGAWREQVERPES